MANLKGCFSHKTDDWKTPTDLYKSYMADGHHVIMPVAAAAPFPSIIIRCGYSILESTK